MPNHQSKQIRDPKRQAWSNKFKLENNSLVNKKLNRKLITLLDTEFLKYGTSANKFIKTLKSKELCRYQSRLLNKYLSNPQEHLTLDCDRLTLSMEIGDSDLDKLLNKDKFLTPYPIKASTVLEIETCGVGKLNNGAGNDVRPLYTHGYKVTLYNDSRRFVHIAISDGSKGERPRKTLRVDFVPQRFTDIEITLVLSKLRSTLTNRRWEQLLKNARVTRVDIGINLMGIMSTFLYPIKPMASQNRCLPNFPKKSIVETTYIQSDRDSLHYIIYEKLLKELNSERNSGYLTTAEDRRDVLNKLAITTRLERRFILNKRNGGLPKVKFKDLADKLDNRLFDLQFVDPLHLSALNKKDLRKLLRNKVPSKVQEIVGKDINVCKFNEVWGAEAQHKLVQHYVNLILKPELVTVKQIAVLTQEFDLVKSKNKKVKVKAKKVIKPVNSRIITDSNLEAIIQTKEKSVLINAGAGSGKTTTMIKRIEHLLNNTQANNAISFISFTGKSARDANHKLSELGIKSVKADTFHSWALKIIKSNPHYKFYNSTKREPSPLKQAIELVTKCTAEKSKAIQAILDYRVNRMVNLKEAYNLTGPHKKLSYKQVKSIHESYKELKNEAGYLDYNDMLERLFRLLKETPSFAKEVAQTYLHILLDEAQDSNKLQWSILKMLSKSGANVFCVGDAAQSIYEFRGACPEMLNTFRKRFGSSPKFLTSHFRSTPEILNLTNYVRRQINPEFPDLVTKNSSGILPRYMEAEGLDELAMKVAKLLYKLIVDGYELDGIGILFRERIDKNRDNSNAVRFDGLKLAFEALVQNSPIENYKYREADFDKCLTTMHKAKGMEWPICIVIDPRFKQTYEESYASHLTLAYVALSRGEKELYVIKPLNSNSKFKDKVSAENIYDKLTEKTDFIEHLSL
ncbi:UvrD-helicase domain-containing protein [Colwellia sp. 20A7]|uniref:UvrD-helicase domain-containing protein n=1 Tax=Colwellia sp. 20A7 TaxID=2689569 RepID=UPI001356D741|nr:UvrD-helicase domain-containing protein [Colwellia sp. 20A7]